MNFHTATGIRRNIDDAILRNLETLRDIYRQEYRFANELASVWEANSHLPGALERAACHRAIAHAYARKLGVV